ncbi:MAG: thioredoxin family protein [Methanomicrobium sp.]|nr:thioredoxin family protein [Methanomicrobium sp.]
MEGSVAELDALNWEKSVERNIKPVIVMFFSENCSHCRTMLPYFEKISFEFKEKTIFGRLNVNKNAWIGDRYGIMSVPTFKFFCGGKPVAEIVGAVNPDTLKKMIDNVIIHGKECLEKSSSIDYDVTGYA